MPAATTAAGSKTNRRQVIRGCGSTKAGVWRTTWSYNSRSRSIGRGPQRSCRRRPSAGLDLVQEFQQRLGRQRRLQRHGAVEIGRLTGRAAHRRRFQPGTSPAETHGRMPREPLRRPRRAFASGRRDWSPGRSGRRDMVEQRESMGGAVRAANLRRRLSFPTVCAPHALVNARCALPPKCDVRLSLSPDGDFCQGLGAKLSRLEPIFGGNYTGRRASACIACVSNKFSEEEKSR